MKKILSLILLSLLAAFALTGCGGQTPAKDEKKPAKLSVVTTIFPVYDWTREIIGDESSHVELTMLLDKGVDLHSYQPTAEDILKISNCDVFIYVGGESDEWVKDALKTATNKNMIVVNLMDVMGNRARPEEHVEGMEEDEHHDHDHDHDHGHEDHDHDAAQGDHHDTHHEEHDHDHDATHEGHEPHDHDAVSEEHKHEHHEDEYDEHIWLSLKNAAVLCNAIENALERADAAHAEAYRKNAAAYKEKLAALDTEYQTVLAAAPGKTVLFGDRFPFRYLVDDYGLTYYAAFSGCSAETEASFKTIAFLAGKADELNLPAVLTIEGRTHKIAETVVQNSSVPSRKILTLDSLQSTTGAEAAQGKTYIDVMKNNLDILNQSLQ